MTKAFEVWRFFPCVDDFSGCHFETLTAYYPLTRPELVTAREQVSLYFISMREPSFSGHMLGNWTLQQHGDILIKAHQGEMLLFESLCQVAPKLSGRGGRAQGNHEFADWLCGLGSEEWDKVSNASQLNEIIPEVNLYLMLLIYCKVAFSPLKLIRKFVFPEDSSGHDSRYTNKDQLEPAFKRSREVDPVGHIYFQFQPYGSRNGAEFQNMIDDEKDGLRVLHQFREEEATARFHPNDEHVMCTDVFQSIRPLVHPETDAVFLSSLLLVPSMAISYCLQFFSDKRINLLESNVLRKKLWYLLLCPHVFRSTYEPIHNVPVSGPDRPHYFGTPRGLLMHELEYSPESVLEPMSMLLQQICVLAKDASIGLNYCRLLIFLSRCSCIIQHYSASAEHRALPEIRLSLSKNRKKLQSSQRRCIPILEGWIQSRKATMTSAEERHFGVELHSALSLLHSFPLLDAHDPTVDFGAFYFSACSVMTMMQAQDSARCPLLDVLDAIHRLRLDATELTKSNVEHRDRILKRMWLAQKRGMPTTHMSTLWRHAQFDLGVFVEQKLTLTFGCDDNPGINTINVSFPGVHRLSIHADAVDASVSTDSESFFTIFRSNSKKTFFEGSQERWFQSDLMSIPHSRHGFLVADVVSDSIEIFKYSRKSNEKMPPWSIHLHARAPVNFVCARVVAERGKILLLMLTNNSHLFYPSFFRTICSIFARQSCRSGTSTNGP
jgi:hypothetical protein